MLFRSAFFEVSVPAPYAKLQQPVIAHVDQATVDGGGTVTVTAVDQMLPTLTILKRDGQTGEVVPVSYTHLDVYKRQMYFSMTRVVEGVLVK